MWLLYALLSVLAWSVAIVLDSIIVKNYEKNPFVLMWTQSCISVVCLLILSFFVPFQTTWLPWLVLTAIVAYAGDIVLFYTMDRVEASVLNLAWAFYAIALSIIGFLVFHEHWSVTQTIGSVCILSATFLFAYWHHHIRWSSLCLLFVIGMLYAPANVVQKASIASGELVYTIIFWQLLAREGVSFTFPWTIPSFRKGIKNFFAHVSCIHYWILAAVVIVSYFAGIYFLAEAYRDGPISLISITANVQPFTVLAMAWVAWRFFPRFASNEYFDNRSVLLKVITFIAVFAGLGLLAI